MKKFNSLKIRLNSFLILLAIIGWSSNSFAQWQYNGNDIYYDEGKVSVGNESGAEFQINQTGVAHMTRQTGGYNLTIENTSYESSLDYGAALFKAPNGVNAIKAEGRVIVTSDFVLTSPDGSGWNLTVDNSGNFSVTSISIPNKSTEITSDYEVNIYPNPTDDLLIVKIDDQIIQMVDIEIYNLTGKMIFMKNFKSNTFEINTSDLSTGTYLIKLKDQEGNLLKTEMFVKE